MDFEHALHIYNTLYSEVNGYSLSTLGRGELTLPHKAFTYGEISPEAFYKILERVPAEKTGIFYDLGSGTGKAIILSHLLFNFSRSVGVVFLIPLHRATLEIIERYEKEFRPLLPNKKKGFTVESVWEDFLKYDFSDGDVVFTHSTCFPDELWEKLVRKFEELKKGTFVITVTKTITSSKLRSYSSKEYGMNWGIATVHVYKRI